MNHVVKEFNSVKDLVIKVLQDKPQTRNSDTLLYLECCRELNATDIDSMERLALNVVTIHKLRQKLNREGLYLPNDNVMAARKNRSKDVREYMIAN